MNDRLLELKVALYLNKTSSSINQKVKHETIQMIGCILNAVNPDYIPLYNDLIRSCINENILGATKKEIFAMLKHYYKKREAMAEVLGYKNPRSFYNAYKEYYSSITDSYLKTLTPVFIKDNTTKELCMIISSFMDEFSYMTGEPYYPYYEHPRSVELEIWLIYSHLLNLFQNTGKVDKFIYEFCTNFDIDFGTISSIHRGMLAITRKSDFKNSVQFRQEIFNLFYMKGFNISEIQSKVLKTNINFYNQNYAQSVKNILNDSFEFQITYVPTLEWKNLDKDAALKYIEIFYDVINGNRKGLSI